MTNGQLLERAMQVIVTLQWALHQRGQLPPEVETEARQTVKLLYAEKQNIDPDPPL